MLDDGVDQKLGRLLETIEEFEGAILNEVRDLAGRIDRRFERLEQRPDT